MVTHIYLMINYFIISFMRNSYFALVFISLKQCDYLDINWIRTKIIDVSNRCRKDHKDSTLHTKNYRKLKNAMGGRNSPPQGRTHLLSIQYSFIVGRSANLHSYYGNQCGGSSARWKLISLKIQLYYSWPYTQKDALPYHIVTCSTMFIASLFIIEVGNNLDVP